jgi:hypothetical protein
MMKAIILLPAVLMLSGCSGLQPKELRAYGNDRLCQAARGLVVTQKAELKEALIDELETRKLMTRAEVMEGKSRTVAIGKNVCYMIATWGMPDSFNQTRTGDAYYVQHIYRDVIGYGARYVYSQNEVITAIQY